MNSVKETSAGGLSPSIPLSAWDCVATDSDARGEGDGIMGLSV